MSHFPHGAMIVVHAANENQRREEKEEEQMTTYSSEDLESNWEFKIVRSTYPIFRKPETFNILLEEESFAGWELVEKLDDRRIRFKRRKDARRRDATLPPGIDPYRTQYGTNTNTIGIVVGLISVLLFAGIFLFIGMDRNSSTETLPWIAVTTAVPVILIVIGLVIFLARARRG